MKKVVDWQPILTAPENQLVMTRLLDEFGERNIQTMTRRGRLWFINVGKPTEMYVYYTPTHWKPFSKKSKGGD